MCGSFWISWNVYTTLYRGGGLVTVHAVAKGTVWTERAADWGFSLRIQTVNYFRLLEEAENSSSRQRR